MEAGDRWVSEAIEQLKKIDSDFRPRDLWMFALGATFESMQYGDIQPEQFELTSDTLTDQLTEAMAPHICSDDRLPD
jgi:hypothetical protein